MNRIKELRNEKKITQKKLAAHLQIADTTLSHWERGKYEPDNTTLANLAEYFECTIDYLLGKSEHRTDKDTLEAAMAGFSHRKTEAGEWVYDENVLTANENRLISYFRGFNQEGQEKALDLLDDLAASGKYIKTGSLGMVVKEKQA